LRVVVDASVIVKWLLPDADGEEHVDQALLLLRDFENERVEILQPPHWLTEVAAVITRLRPEAAESMIDLLDAMELPVASDVNALKRASRLAHELNHHLFDTLYHAVAFEHGGVLVTADDRYFKKAEKSGSILALQNWSGPVAEPSGST
jgi:predicted nucleic acid-binding protein